MQPRFRHPLEYVPTGNIKSELAEVRVPPGSQAEGKSLLDLKLPGGVLVVLIHRGEDVIVPRGSTVIEPGDVLLVLAEADAIRDLRQNITST